MRAAGARFGVSPGLTPTLVDAAHASGLPWLPGLMTSKEMIVAHTAGSAQNKLFSAQQAVGIGMLRAMYGPFLDVVF